MIKYNYIFFVHIIFEISESEEVRKKLVFEDKDEDEDEDDDEGKKQKKENVFAFCSNCNTQADVFCPVCIQIVKSNNKMKIKVDKDGNLESADKCTACSTLARCKKCRNISEMSENVSLEGNNSSSSPCRHCTGNDNQEGKFTLSKIIQAIISLIIGTSTRTRKRYDKLAQTEERGSVSEVTCSTDTEQDAHTVQYNQYKDWELGQ
ncbi:uncharacterized protein LOC111717316 isoform X2 [Eurytemora carolleeae]|uniref:uncharacterized protein LOC111717316 isoform X2 n=1 Tax=Eurytemora carolleeae TaxID=1294199 RepID=UPI000C76A8E4|nr:uncharacterized protein LOC111717316 isoform X2 [Eurytemora carolleeae]|eukprot:XP_023348581.1 uncharacterized protein LOC111717316 isoform X2 [Eurytemora affinis]